MFTFRRDYPLPLESLTTGLLSVIFYLAITVAIYFLLVLNGRKIVNNPCLVDDEEDHKHK